MRKNLLILLILLVSFNLSGCASVPMGSKEEDSARKEFSPPSQGMAGLYIYRHSIFGSSLKKAIYVDDIFIGESASRTYFYVEVQPGKHKLSTQSEFSNNDLIIDTESGRNYFIQQYIKVGVFVGGANFELALEEAGKRGVRKSKLAKKLKVKPKEVDDDE